jgi:hypothetical protein
MAIRGAFKVIWSHPRNLTSQKRNQIMKRTLSIALAVLALASGSAFADSQFPKPSFADSVELPTYSVTGTATVQQDFPKGSYAGGGGPKGPATVVTQASEVKAAVVHATAPLPSFNG